MSETESVLGALIALEREELARYCEEVSVDGAIAQTVTLKLRKGQSLGAKSTQAPVERSHRPRRGRRLQDERANIVTNDLHFSGSLHNLLGWKQAGRDVRIVRARDFIESEIDVIWLERWLQEQS